MYENEMLKNYIKFDSLLSASSNIMDNIIFALQKTTTKWDFTMKILTFRMMVYGL